MLDSPTPNYWPSSSQNILVVLKYARDWNSSVSVTVRLVVQAGGRGQHLVPHVTSSLPWALYTMRFTRHTVSFDTRFSIIPNNMAKPCLYCRTEWIYLMMPLFHGDLDVTCV